MTRIQRVAAEIVRRRIVIPFEHGPDVSGIFLGEWSPKGHFNDGPPTFVKNARLYCVREGRPFALWLPGLPCKDPAALDAEQLYLRAAGRNQGTRAPVETDGPFADLAWGRGTPLSHCTPMVYAANRFHGKGRDGKWEAMDEADRILASSLRAHDGFFIGRMDGRARELMEFMRDALPYFRWGAFDALYDDAGGGTRAFAEAYPLVAGVTLADEGVAGAARAGDLRLAFELSLRPGLACQDAFDVAAVAARADLARVVDGSRRGWPVGMALRLVPALDRNHVPRTAAEFRDYVDACEWARQVAGGGELSSERELVAGMGGRWGKVLAACREAATVDGKAAHPTDVDLYFGLMCSQFLDDLVRPAVNVAFGAQLTQVDKLKGKGTTATMSAREHVLLRGMNVPDRIRHAMRYRGARPGIVGASRRSDPKWRSGNLARDDLPWVRVDDDLEVRVLFLGSYASYEEWEETRKRGERKVRDVIGLAADVPEGQVLISVLRRGAASTMLRGHTYIRSPFKEWERVKAALSLHYGCGGPDDLGPALLMESGHLGRASADAKAHLDGAAGRLVVMRDAWGNVLPRRFRRTAAAELANALADEFAEAMDLANAEVPD